MSEMKSIRFGDRLPAFPAKTFNALIAGEEARRNSLANDDDPRRAKSKSTVIVQLVWAGAGLLPPGNVVKLGEVVHDPTADASAPFSGLKFHCDTFEAEDGSDKFAITLGPIKGGGTGVGYGVMPNAWWAKVDINDLAHTTCGPPDTGTLLESGRGSIQIVWKQAGTGEKWAVVGFGGGGGGSTIRFARVYATITAATSNLAAHWGGGLVKFQDDTTGILDTDPTAVDNLLIDISFATDTQVLVDTAYDPPRVLNGTCDAVDWNDPIGGSTIVNASVMTSNRRRYHAPLLNP